MLDQLKLIAHSLVELFSPLVEVVIHDLKSNQIVFIEGPRIHRKVGDASYLSKEDKMLEYGVLGPYIKKGSDGLAQKSMSIVLGEKDKPSQFMMCINFDINHFKEMETFLQSFVGRSNLKTQSYYFEDNWQDQVHKDVGDYIAEKKKLVDQLSKQEKQELIVRLQKKGAFKGKDAANYIGNILNISRATVYGYLKKK